MENKDQYNTPSAEVLEDVHQPPSSSNVVQPPNGMSALSLENTAREVAVITDTEVTLRPRRFVRYAKKLGIGIAALLIIAAAVFVFFFTRHNANTGLSFASRFGTVKIPLDRILASQELNLTQSSAVTINGTLQLNNGLLVTPSLQPTGAKAGQIYYDQGTNQLAYFNGSTFVFLTGPQETPGGVQSLGGATGQLAVGTGLSLTNNQLNNNGVLSVQGQNGAVTFEAGPGLVINGTTFSNSGILSVSSGSPNVTVANDGQGGVTISVDQPIAGTGTVTSSGGTAGTIPVFTANQNIEDSIITQSGLTVTISGDLSVITGGLSLSNALTVSNGGTGNNSLALNGVLVGQGTGAIGSVTAGAAGLCLLSTSGVPTWGVCPGGSGVATLNGLSGALNIANASAAGSTITIDDASTTNKGIASFNGTNFSVSGGAVNTIQDINAAATPTFAGVNTNTITPNAPLTLGISAQTAFLQGSTTTITSNGVGNNIVLNSAGTIELQDTTNVTGNFNASGDVAVNGGDITSSTALNITPGGTLTVGSASQTLTLQGGASTSFRASSGGNTTVVGFTNPVANTTLSFPALAAGTYTICTTSGNCAGAATTLQGAYDNSSTPEIILDATRGGLTLRDNASPISGNLLEVQNNTGSATYLAVTSSGAAITGTATVSGNINTTSGGLQTGGTIRIDNSGNAVNLGSLTLSGAISGGTTITSSGNINSTGGGLQTNSTTRVDNSGNLINIASVTASGSATFQGGSATLGTNSQAGSIVLSDGSANTGSLQVAALGQNTVYTLPDPGGASATICLSTGNCAGTAGGVTTGGGTTNKLAKFNGTQTITDSSITDDGSNVTVAVDVIIQGGDLTVGSASQPASIVLHDGNGQTTTLQAGDSAGNLNFILPTNTGVANQCLKQSGTGNQLVWQDCDGGSSGSSATLQTAYNNSTNPEITLNSSVGGLTIRDNSTPVGGNLFEIQNNLGSTTYLAVTATGTSVNGTASATGNINSSGGGLQTGGTTRIDNSGNAVNIGNITGSGAMTIASVGAGNDITIDGADQFIVQDASVFNALTTFNANLDVGSHNIIGTTGNIDLTNFDVAGATGNVTAGTYNGQTISSAANFTGTITAAGAITTSGDIAVNGGDLTSTGALNITPGGTLTVGATGQQLILQGSANTQLTATGGGFTTTVGFAGSPIGNVTYNFDRATAAGTYTICTTIGNCAGSGGGVTTPGGTTGTIAVFTGSQTLGDSLLSQSGGTVTVSGNLNLTTGNQFRINGTQISSANLSNDANLAKLSASQTFTGNTVAFQNGINSTNAFNVQNAGGNRIMSVSTADGQVILGQASILNGQLVFMNVSNGNKVTIQPGTVTGDRTLTLPDASGIICTDSGNCAGAGATLQTGYNFSVGGTTPKIKVNSTLGGVDIQDADTPIGANLLNIRSSNGAGLGSVLFGIGNTGQLTLQNSSNSTAAFRLLTQGGTSVLAGDTTNGQILLGQSSTLNGSLVFRNASGANTITLTAPTATANRSITLPDAAGVVCLNSGNCSGSGSANTLQAAYDAGNTVTTTSARDVSFTMADSATDANFVVNLQCTVGCSTNGRFAVQNGGTDVFSVAPNGGAVLFKNSANSLTAFQIQNATGGIVFDADTTNGRVGIGNAAPGYALDVTGDINSSTALRVGGTQVCTASGCITNGNYVQLQGATPGTPQTGNLNISGTAIAGANLQSPLTYTNTLDTISGTTVLNIGTTNATAGINLNQNVTLASGKTLTVQGTSSFKTPTDSTTALQVLNSGNGKVFVVDTSNNFVRVVTGTITNITTASGTGALQIGADNTDNLAFDDNEIMARVNGSASTLYLQKLGGGLNIQANATLVKPSTNGTTTFQIQNAGATTTVLDADTTNGRIGIGTAAPAYALDVVGDVNASVTLKVAGTTVCDNVGGAGCVAKSGSGFYIHNQTTVQTANLYVQAATSGSVAAVFQANAAGTGDIADFLNGTGTTVGSISSAGSVLFKPSTNSTSAFQVQPSGSTTPVINVDTTNSRFGIGIAAPSTTLDVAVNNTQVTTPMALLEQAGTGDVTIGFKNPSNSFYIGQDTSNSSFAISSSVGASTSTTPAYVQSSTATNDATGPSLAASLPTTTTGNLVAVTVSWDTNTTSTFTCSDTQGNTYANAIIRIDATSQQAVGVCYAPNIIGGADTVTVTFGASAIFRRVLVSEYSGIATSSPVDVTSSNVAAGTTTANGVTSGSATTTQAGDLIYGSVNDTASTTTITAGTGFTQHAAVNGTDTASQDQVQSSAGSIASTQTFGSAHRYVATMVAFKAASTGSSDTFASSLFNLSQTGATTFKNASNSSAAFRIQTAGGANLFNIDSSSNVVSIGTGSTSGPTPTLLVLSNKNSSADPTGAAGAMYYNASLGKFRCYESGAWKNCITSAADLARYRADGTQTLTNGNNTKLAFSQFDSLSSYVNISAGNDTFTLLKAGIWSITANARYTNAPVASGERYVAIMDGAGSLTTGNRYAQQGMYAASASSGTVSATTTRRFNANDTISVLGYQATGATSTVDATWNGTNVSLTFLGD